jgi:hypothetical protein
VAILIIGIVVDVLGHVGIKALKGGGVGGIPRTSWNFAILDTSEFVVLLPQISFQDFGRCEKPENSHIALRKSASSQARCFSTWQLKSLGGRGRRWSQFFRSSLLPTPMFALRQADSNVVSLGSVCPSSLVLGEDWVRLMNVNVRGVFLCSKYAISLMDRAGAGSIVNMGSYTANVAIRNREACLCGERLRRRTKN